MAGIAYSDTFQPFVDDSSDIFSQILNVAYATTLTLTEISFGGSGANDDVGDSHFDAPDTDEEFISEFVSGTPGYIAFVMTIVEVGYYGWMRVTLKNDGTIHEWAYSSDENFQVGQIPEPAAVLFGGIGVLLLLRRRRQAWR